jgi:hypothetical protein
MLKQEFLMKRFFFILLTLSLLSCATKPMVIPTTEPIITTISDITFTLTYLTEEQLEKTYGKNESVFANYPGLLPRKKSVVFKMDISSPSIALKININDINLTIGDVTGTSKTQKQLLRSWNFYIESREMETSAKKMVKNTMFDETILISPGDTASGWIVFLESYPDSGDALLTMNVTDESGNDGIIEIPLQFTDDGKTKTFLSNLF